MGAASRTAMPATIPEATIMGRIPPRRPMLSGDSVRNTQLMWGKPWARIKPMIKNNIETRARVVYIGNDFFGKIRDGFSEEVQQKKTIENDIEKLE